MKGMHVTRRRAQAQAMTKPAWRDLISRYLSATLDGWERVDELGARGAMQASGRRK